MPKITFIAAGARETHDVDAGKTLLEAALDRGISMEHACGGNGFCTTCKCRIHNGGELLSPRNDREENMGVIEEHERLGCQAVIERDGEVTAELLEF